MTDFNHLAKACKNDLINAARQADESGIAPNEKLLGIHGVSLSSLEISIVLSIDVVLYLSVSFMGEVIRGRIESGGPTALHVEPLEGEDLDDIARVFGAHVIDATEKLLSARVGL